MSEQATAFKHWFGENAVKRMGDDLARGLAAFDRAKYEKMALEGLAALELKGRVKHIAEAIEVGIRPAREKLGGQVALLRALMVNLPPKLGEGDAVTDATYLWPLGQWVGDQALDEPDVALDFLCEYTQRFTAEFAVRPFILQNAPRVLDRLTAWALHPSAQVRRWCSEGTRPRLPWGSVLRPMIENPQWSLDLLNYYADERELYVMKSVANHLNDVSKDHPEMVVKWAEKWWRNGTKEQRWMVKHGLRSLIKDGNQAALALLGYEKVEVDAAFSLGRERVSVGESMLLQLELRNATEREQGIVIDYAVHYQRLGGRMGRKVFKWKTLVVAGQTSVKLEKSHPFRVTTIRALYSGEHRVELLLNGETVAVEAFHLDGENRLKR